MLGLRVFLTTPHRVVPNVTICVVAIALSVVFAVGITVWPVISLAPAALFGSILLAKSGLYRFCFVTFGGLLTLQSAEGFDPKKSLYMVGCALALAFTLMSINSGIAQKWAPAIRPLVVVSGAWILLVICSLPVSIIHGTPTIDWLRDSIPYLLFAVMPLFALDCAKSVSISSQPNAIRLVFVVFGLLSIIAFAVTFHGRRGYVDLGIDHLMLVSFAIPSALFVWSCAQALAGSGRSGWWAFLAFFTLLLLLSTGTRSYLVLLIVPVVLLFKLDRRYFRSAIRSTPSLLFGILFASVAALLIVNVADLNTDPIVSRFQTLGQLTGDSVAGQSFSERAAQTTVQLEAIRESPLLGVGPGYSYQWLSSQGKSESSFVLDSPLSVTARFGVIGLFLYIATLRALMGLYFALPKSSQYSLTMRSVLVTFVVLTVAISIFLSPMDDKGFSFAVGYMIALALTQIPTEPERLIP